MMMKINPCPFCGNAGLISNSLFGEKVFISCENDDCGTTLESREKNLNKVIERWNLLQSSENYSLQRKRIIK